MLLRFSECRGYRLTVVALGGVMGVNRSCDLLQFSNASALTAQGVAGIETNPRRFYLSGSGTFPDKITGVWCDL